jgi:hypothetical protein
MANIDEELLNQPTLGEPREQLEVANQFGSDQAMERNKANNPAAGSTAENLTDGQSKGAARKAQEAETAKSSEAEGEGIGLSSATSKTLKGAWLNLIDSFGLTLIYINLHVFGHSVLGEKIFCSLGEEWIPNNLRSGLGSSAVKNKIKALGLIEKIVLIILDLIVVLALLGSLTILVLIAAVFTGSFVIIVKMGWEAIKSLLSLFGDI